MGSNPIRANDIFTGIPGQRHSFLLGVDLEGVQSWELLTVISGSRACLRMASNSTTSIFRHRSNRGIVITFADGIDWGKGMKKFGVLKMFDILF